jgi:hypothetical protein
MSSAFSTYELVADKQIRAVGGYLSGLAVMTDGSNDATVILYDVNSVASIAVTNKLAEVKVAAANNFGGRDWSNPVRFAKGLYADVTGTGASYIVEWMK